MATRHSCSLVQHYLFTIFLFLIQKWFLSWKTRLWYMDHCQRKRNHQAWPYCPFKNVGCGDKIHQDLCAISFKSLCWHLQWLLVVFYPGTCIGKPLHSYKEVDSHPWPDSPPMSPNQMRALECKPSVYWIMHIIMTFTLKLCLLSNESIQRYNGPATKKAWEACHITFPLVFSGPLGFWTTCTVKRVSSGLL